MNEGYVPMMHSYLFNSCRVPVFIDDGEYCICVGKGEYRYYTQDTLPDAVKALFSMIHTIPFNDKQPWEVNPVDVYINNHDARLNETGWRVNESIYMLVLDNELLEQLRGGSHDTRRQS